MQIRLETVGITGKKNQQLKIYSKTLFTATEFTSGLIDKKVSNAGLPCFPGD